MTLIVASNRGLQLGSGLLLGIAVLASAQVIGCSRRTPPAQGRSGAEAARYIGIVLPTEAGNLRYYEQSLFTLTCFFSFDMDTSRVEAFLSGQAMLPAQSDFGADGKIVESINAMGSAAPWWDLPGFPDTTYAERQGQRTVKGIVCAWTSTVALASAGEDRTRVFIVYVEETSTSSGG